MKTSKKLLLLIVPIIILAAAAAALVFAGASLSSYPSFVGSSNYVRLMVKDKLFVRSLVNTFVPSLVCSVIVVIALAVLRRFVKPLKNDKIFYPVGVASASVAALVVLIIIRRVSGVPSALYGSLIVSSIVDVYPMTIQTRFLNIIVSLIIGFLTMLLFLLAETLFGFIMRKRREKKIDKDVD